MHYFLRYIMRAFPIFWVVLGILNALLEKYDLATYNMAAGAFFMILPMYYAFLDEKGDQ